MVDCRGCGRKRLKRSGIVQHCSRSNDPRCQSYLAQLRSAKLVSVNGVTKAAKKRKRDEPESVDDEDVTMELGGRHSSGTGVHPVENVGDIISEDTVDNGPYSAMDGAVIAGSGDDSISSEDEGGTASDKYSSDSDTAPIAQHDIGLEPRRRARPPSPNAAINPNANRTTPERAAGGLSEQERPQDDDSLQRRGEVGPVLERRPKVTRYPGGNAGVAHSKKNMTENQKYEAKVGDVSQSNPYAPFASSLDWQIAKWAKLRGPSSTAFTEMMAIDGVQERLEMNRLVDSHLPGRPPFQRKEVLVGDEVCEVFYRDIIQCIRALFGDPDLAPYLIFAPEKHYIDDERTEQMYHDMHTGSWWWTTQAAVEKVTPRATIVPVLVSTDKTQLTLFRNKSAYPIYMTIGNIPKEIRRKSSLHSYVLLGYLPTTKLEQVVNKAKRKRLTANLYHACMRRILEPLVSAGKDGVFMSTAEGLVHRNHPILASFIGDYPEQILATCSIYGDCPVCGTPQDDLGDFKPDDVPPPRQLDTFLEALDSFWGDSAGFLQTCSKIRMKPVPQPFWLGLPYLNIYQSITPDVLHQLYQGVVKHLKSWVIEACGPAEIDARCRRLPPNHNIRLFVRGISSLSRVTGHEHDQICQFFLGLIIDIRLPDNLSNVRLLRSVRAILDLLYLAQYPIHTDSTLGLLTDALSQFHANKEIFVQLGIRAHFNIPKFHFLSHYVESIKSLGTTDNFNTQYTERLHIDLAKDAYAATNRKDEYEQMTLWLDHKERIHRHDQHIKWRLAGSPIPKRVDWTPPDLNPRQELTMAKHPTQYAVPLDRLQDLYGAPLFKVALRRFISATNNPDQTRQQLESSLWGLRLPFNRLPVWHVIKFTRFDPITGKNLTSDAIHAQPTRKGKHNRLITGRFDTALINDGTGKEHGVKGYCVGRIRVIFSIPQKYLSRLFDPRVSVPLHLAYVQWYSPLTVLDPNNGMFKIRPQKDLEGNWICSIVPVGNIRRSVHLLPKFGPVVPAEWTSSSVLDHCDTFFVNNRTDRQIFHTLHNSVN
ncbi:hypothetical protein H4582DRAFT_2111250 [Lactarius indigo]|nr:hypothetical protein H4582DRAFT_2111250 [Lactarius indigo]